MSNYFKRFPKIEIDPFGRRNIVQYTDFFRFIDVNDIMVDDYSNYLLYEIEDGDRPDVVSYKLYRTPDYYWTFFIVNDRLKNGMREWPLSSIEFEDYIRHKYKDYGVCVIPPERQTSDTTFVDLNDGDEEYDLMNDIPNFFANDLNSSPGPISNAFTGRNSLLGLDYKNPNLRIRRLASNSDQSARIVDYDERKFQLWVTENKDKFFFSDFDSTIEGSGDIQFFLVSPDSDAEKTNQEWLKKTRDTWLKENYPDRYENIIQGGADLQTTIEEAMIFQASGFYREAKNAPRYYVDQNDEPICPLYCVIEEAGFPITNLEQEERDNELKRSIRVIRPSLVTRFADEYRSILRNNPRLR